jgi:hypothetical protein
MSERPQACWYIEELAPFEEFLQKLKDTPFTETIQDAYAALGNELRGRGLQVPLDNPMSLRAGLLDVFGKCLRVSLYREDDPRPGIVNWPISVIRPLRVRALTYRYGLLNGEQLRFSDIAKRYGKAQSAWKVLVSQGIDDLARLFEVNLLTFE